MTFMDALKMLKPYRRQMGVIVVLALIISAISMITPFVNRNMLDDGLLQGEVTIVIQMVLLLILLQIGGQFIEYIQRRLEINITNELGKKLKTEAFKHGLKLKPHYFKEKGFYKTISDALYDISNIMNIASNSFLVIFVIICKCIGAMIGLVILDWRLSIFIAIIIPIKLWLNYIIRKQVENRSEKVRNDNKDYNTWLSNILSGITDIKLWNLRKKVSAEYENHVESINQSSRNLSLLRAKNVFFTMSIEYILMNGLYILGAYLIAGSHLTFGGLMAFITFSVYVLTPVNIIMELRIILKQIAPSVGGLRRFYELEEEYCGISLPIVEQISNIEFKNVFVTFEDRKILKDFNLKIFRGEKVAIVGENGAGKTTIINLLLRICEPDSGEILMNGTPITEFEIEEYRQKFSTVYQNIHLFKGTVKDNITFNENSNFELVEDVCLRFCTEAIESWENQYETQVGSEGAKLSGGEQQKIALLRALYRKSEILILDEPTSNYDKDSDEEFWEYLQGNADYGFYFIVTHHRDIFSYVDKVLVIEDGAVIYEDSGTADFMHR